MKTTDARRALTLVLVAAGDGRRMGGISKVWRLWEGHPIWWWSLMAFQGQVATTVLVVASDCVAAAQTWVGSEDVVVVAGGPSRDASVVLGLARVATPYVAVHDGARPLVSRALVDRVWRAALQTGAAVPGLPPTDTVKVVHRGLVARTLPRHHLVAVQTPQIFRTDWLRDALAQERRGVTDDSMAVEARGHAVAVVEGDVMNQKLTVELDWLWLAAAWPERDRP